MEWLGNRKENRLFSLPLLLGKRESGNIAPSLGESEQIHPRVGGQQTSILSQGENHGPLRRAGTEPGLPGDGKRGAVPRDPALCGAAVSQEADAAHQNPVVL